MKDELDGIHPSAFDGDRLIGVDFSGPRSAARQRQKTIALAADRLAPGHYRIASGDFNARLQERTQQPGWTAEELAAALTGDWPAYVVGFDFLFSIPRELLQSASFARAAGAARAFRSWEAFNRFVAEELPLRPPADYFPFAAWRSKLFWKPRATDRAAAANPPLKHMFQVLFNMTLLGNALLAALASSGRYAVVPFQSPGIGGAAIEVYPGLTMRRLGWRAYKRDPKRAIACLLDACAERGVTLELDAEVRAFCETYRTAHGEDLDPDASDALIALVTAILYREGHCEEVVPPGSQALKKVEGAIWAPVSPGGTLTSRGAV
jgi:hypothetical protein